MVIDCIGIRDNMREAMKVYGGDTSVAPTSDDVEHATSVFRAVSYTHLATFFMIQTQFSKGIGIVNGFSS